MSWVRRYSPEPWPPGDEEVNELAHFLERHQDTSAAHRSIASRFAEYFDEHAQPDELARRIDEWTTEGTAVSLIRLGDGEGNLLALGSERYPALARYCARNRALKHFGDPAVLVDHTDEILPPFEEAIRHATVIGLPTPFVIDGASRGELNAGRVGGAFGVGSVYDYLDGRSDQLDLGAKQCWPSSFHYLLKRHYGELMRGRVIGVVSCHRELADRLRDHLGAEHVVFHAVPEQAVLSGARHATGHYPDRYRALLGELEAVGPGDLYFVAAGMLGKIYCEVIRRAGGVAVDIGSVADLWAGVRSRILMANEVEPWQLAPR